MVITLSVGVTQGDAFQLHGGCCWVEICWNRIARCPERQKHELRLSYICTRTMSMLAPSLHRESTDTVIRLSCHTL